MPHITVGTQNSTDVNLFYEDHGAGQPLVLIHGYPLNGRSWEKQLPALLDAGYRVIAYDRRGFGNSSHPTSGYDYDTFADDLKVVIDTLGLTDVILVGFSMGTGEVGRYVGRYGTSGLSKLVFLAPLEPFLIKTGNHEVGLDPSVFAGVHDAATKDRFAHYAAFASDFYNTDVYLGDRVSEYVVQHAINDASQSSAYATLHSIEAWSTDFREDITKIDIPTLIAQGVEDRILPIDIAGREFHKALPHADYVEIPGAPHGMQWTHAEELNKVLLDFLSK